MPTNFTIWKNTKKEKQTQPDFIISVKNGEKFEEYGACWVKNTKPDASGKTRSYMSCQQRKAPEVVREEQAVLPPDERPIIYPTENSADFSPF